MASDFGRGLSYCLALFLCHAERDAFFRRSKEIDELDKKLNKMGKEGYSHEAELWFNGASDHLYDLEIPATLPKVLQKRLKNFQEKALNWGHGFKMDVRERDKNWAIKEAKDLVRLIDEHFGVRTEEAQWR